MSNDIKFVDGLIVKAPHENAPDFVKCSISIKRADLGNWLRAQEGEWINVQVKESKGGKWYAAVDEWKPSQEAASAKSQPVPADDFDYDKIPF
jgi:hypothetical protein